MTDDVSIPEEDSMDPEPTSENEAKKANRRAHKFKMY